MTPITNTWGRVEIHILSQLVIVLVPTKLTGIGDLTPQPVLTLEIPVEDSKNEPEDIRSSIGMYGRGLMNMSPRAIRL